MRPFTPYKQRSVKRSECLRQRPPLTVCRSNVSHLKYEECRDDGVSIQYYQSRPISKNLQCITLSTASSASTRLSGRSGRTTAESVGD